MSDDHEADVEWRQVNLVRCDDCGFICIEDATVMAEHERECEGVE